MRTDFLRGYIYTPSAVIIQLYHTVLELLTRIARSEFEGRTLTLKIKFAVHGIQVCKLSTYLGNVDQNHPSFHRSMGFDQSS